MNWGKKIAIVYIGFVIFMLGLVYMCLQQKDIFLVTEDYYKQELAFQDKIDAVQNANALSTPVAVLQTSDGIAINFPEECKGASGNAILYRPSDAGQDIRLPFKLSASSTLPIATANLAKGSWTLKLDWKDEANKQYYLEQKLTL